MSRPPSACSLRLPVSASLLALALVAAAAVPARAAVDARAKPVLERYVQAIGGPEAAQVRTVHTIGRITAYAMTGRVESWTMRPDRSALRMAIGPLQVSAGLTGAEGWRTDPGSGKVVRLDGKELADERGNTWFDSEAWLEPDQGGGSVTWTGEEQDSLGRLVLLHFQPPVGRDHVGAFDATSGLLVRTSAKNDQRTVVTRLLDYRREGARLVPHTTVAEIVGQPMNTMRMVVDTVEVGVPVPEAVFAPPEQRASLQWLKTPGRARLPFDYSVRHVWLRASVNGGPPADFIFDTGAGITVIDSAYAASIGVKPEGMLQGEGAGALGRVSFADVRSLRIAGPDGDGVEMSGLHVAVLSASGLIAPYFWRGFAGIIGFDVISRFVDTIDYDGRVLTLQDPATYRHEGDGAAVTMTLAGGMPVVPMTVDGLEGGFRLDVGSGSTVDLHGPFVKKHGLAERAARSVAVTGGGFGGTFTNHIVRMKRITIGPYAWDDPLVSLSGATEGAFASEDYAGNIGNRILERFKVTLDYERRQLWLEPGKLYGRRDVMSRAGLQLARQEGKVQVMDVLGGPETRAPAAGKPARALRSAAAEAGLRRGDVVTHLDGRPIDTVGADGASALLDEGAEGSVHTLTIVRDGKSKTVKIKLRETI